MTLTVHEMERDAFAAFAFLETDFGCERAGVEGESWWRRLIYRSNTGFAEIYRDEREEMVRCGRTRSAATAPRRGLHGRAEAAAR